MNTASGMTESETYKSLGLSSDDFAKIGDRSFVWLLIPFPAEVRESIAAFSSFECALKLAQRLNAFAEDGVGLRPVSASMNKLEVDRYKKPAEIGMTPFTVRLNENNGNIELVDIIGDNLDELEINEALGQIISQPYADIAGTSGISFHGTFWAPSSHLAIKKAKVFQKLLIALVNKERKLTSVI
ncbi:hypothetical protein [Dyadobacter sp. CY347]|uniref:hypothetical protein n=1 Tax=Dyadobacter sp. CY347 TaxID=2909336 RepID=UPI001F28A0C1|nr:hypothetical protein [Dyadobacter sp. CY347]MCF2489188.1 hypothetical protein [Dyadobacter sp. CY347]